MSGKTSLGCSDIGSEDQRKQGGDWQVSGEARHHQKKVQSPEMGMLLLFLRFTKESNGWEEKPRQVA